MEELVRNSLIILNKPFLYMLSENLIVNLEA